MKWDYSLNVIGSLENVDSYKYLGVDVDDEFQYGKCLKVYRTSLNVDSLIGSTLPKIESTCLTTIIGLEI